MKKATFFGRECYVSHVHKTSPSTSKAVKQSLLGLCFLSVFLSGCNKMTDVLIDDEGLKNSKDAVATTHNTGADFTIAVIPDTQNYVQGTQTPGILEMFTAQTEWIINNKVSQNIAYVIHLGDITQNGDNSIVQFPNAAKAMYKLDTAGIAYGTAVGNHDQYPNGSWSNGSPLTSTTTKYNETFGVNHFSGKSFYGGYYGDNNDSHYDLFSAGGLDFIVIYLEFDDKAADAANMNTWAYNLLGTYASRKAIIVTHNMGMPTAFSAQAQAIYDRLKSRPNVFMFLGGHVDAEGVHQKTYEGKTIRTFISNYQFRANGGDGFMRLMKISTANDLISVKTYSPFLNTYETDSNSQFVKPLFHEPATVRTFDFDNDGKSQIGFYDDGTWKIDGISNENYGLANRIPVPADYDGDGQTDKGTFNNSTGDWAINYMPFFNHGGPGDIPVQGDYNGDGKADVAVFRPSNGTWYVKNILTEQFGLSTYIPVHGDYDGDGKTDIAVFNPSGSLWHVKGIVSNRAYGATGYIPVPGDYNGDGKTDIAVFSPGNGIWHLDGKAPNVTVVAPAAGDVPVPGDYFGDGKTHPAIFRPSTGKLYKYNNGTVTITTVSNTYNANQILNLPYHIRKFFFP